MYHVINRVSSSHTFAKTYIDKCFTLFFVVLRISLPNVPLATPTLQSVTETFEKKKYIQGRNEISCTLRSLLTLYNRRTLRMHNRAT